MTIAQLRPHLCIGFSKLPEKSYLHLNEVYEIDSLDRKEVHMHEVRSGAPIIQSICHLRSTHMFLA